MKADDFFADQVHLGRPVAFERCIGKSDAREVVGERIYPDVDHLVRRARHRNAPAHVASAHRKIRQALCELTQHLVASRFRLHEVGLAHQEFERALVPRQAEEPVFLGHDVARQPMDRAGVADQLVRLVVRLAA